MPISINDALHAVTGPKHMLYLVDYLPDGFKRYAAKSHKARNKRKMFRPVEDHYDYALNYNKGFTNTKLDDITTELVAVQMSLINEFYGSTNANAYAQRRLANKRRCADAGDLHPFTLHDIVAVCTAGLWELRMKGGGFYIIQHTLRNENMHDIMHQNLRLYHYISQIINLHASHNSET